MSWIKGETTFFSNSPVLPTLHSIVMEVKLVEIFFYGHYSVSSDTNNMQATLHSHWPGHVNVSQASATN